MHSGGNITLAGLLLKLFKHIRYIMPKILAPMNQSVVKDKQQV